MSAKEYIDSLYKELENQKSKYQCIKTIDNTANFSEDPSWFFRGQSNSEWQLQPSILRANQTKCDPNYIDSLSINGSDTLSKIAKQQHYSVATRCLDFTIDFNIALYFACTGNDDKDGLLYMCPYSPHNYYWFTGMCLAKIDLLDSEREYNLCEYEEFLKTDAEFINEFKNPDRDMDSLAPGIISVFESGCMVVFDLPVINNERMLAQKGTMFVCGNNFTHKIRRRFMSSVTYTKFLHKAANDPSVFHKREQSERRGMSHRKLTVCGKSFLSRHMCLTSMDKYWLKFYPKDVSSPSWLEKDIIRIKIAKEYKKAILEYIDSEFGINKDSLMLGKQLGEEI